MRMIVIMPVMMMMRVTHLSHSISQPRPSFSQGELQRADPQRFYPP